MKNHIAGIKEFFEVTYSCTVRYVEPIALLYTAGSLYSEDVKSAGIGLAVSVAGRILSGIEKNRLEKRV